ncbi:MAG: hypothetical protein JWQ28_1231 [Pedobacter sp.]|jgi:hypothetical protein|nr:hypothetical protein [Pedobacter sp.]
MYIYVLVTNLQHNQGMLKFEHVKEGADYYFASVLVTALMSPLVFLILKNERLYGKQQPE